MKALEKSRGFLQAKINSSLHVKRTPQLQFFYDDTLDNALRIERALRREEEVLGKEAPEILVGGADEAGSGAGSEDDAPSARADDRLAPPGRDGEELR